MKIPYLPGCTLKTTAKNFESSAIAVCKELGIEFVELQRWNCCGTVYSLATDNLIYQTAAIRNLLRVEEMKENKLVTLCSMCYNTLKRANLLVKEDKEKLKTLNAFMDADYKASVTVLHLLELMKEIGFEKIKVKKKLNGLRVAPYYGCLLTRPKEIGFDNIEEPVILGSLLNCLGADVIDYPYKTECCGSYHTVMSKDVVANRTFGILNSAKKFGAEAIVVSCPLCEFNLDWRQKDTEEKYHGFEKIPVFYFTQLLALALGIDMNACRFDLHYVDPIPLLKEKNLLE
ncbi:MAG: CoB--CoM heterodisulfide reductase iron-sulfur subunit B family protein [Candidatus Thermoplasmatota archaeon]